MADAPGSDPGGPRGRASSTLALGTSIRGAMRLLFLDIDGVLNSASFFERTKSIRERRLEVGDPGSHQWWAVQLDHDAVARLNRIIEETQALVVVSSTWRIGNTRHDLQAILEMGGFKGHVLGKTPNLGDRGKEIWSWMQDLKDTVENLVILDDCAAENVEPLGRFLVPTSWQEGLQDEQVTAAIELLRGRGGTADAPGSNPGGF